MSETIAYAACWSCERPEVSVRALLLAAVHCEVLREVLVELRDVVAIERLEPREHAHDLELVAFGLARARVPAEVERPHLRFTLK